MRKIFIAAMLLVAFALTGCGSDSNFLSPSKNGLIKIGIDDAFAPMGFRNEKGELVGFDIDLAKEAARRMNVKIEFKPINWANKRGEITSGNIDMIWNNCDVTEERKEYMIFSKPYMLNRQVLIVKKGNAKSIRSLEDLEAKIVGTQAGSNSEDYVNENEAFKKILKEFKTYTNYKEALRELDNGSVDVLIIDEIVGRYAILKSRDKFEIVELTVGSVTEVAIGFRKDNTELRDKVQKVFDEMIRDGTAEKISEQWFHADLIRSKR